MHLHIQAYAFTHKYMSGICIYTHKYTPGICTAPIIIILTNFISIAMVTNFILVIFSSGSNFENRWLEIISSAGFVVKFENSGCSRSSDVSL